MKRMPILLRLFVLAAMTLSFAETVWASTCASMSMMAVTDATADDVAMSQMPGMPGMPGMPADGEQQDGEDDPWCPLGPAAVAQGCLTAASLPVASAELFAETAERAAHVIHVDAANEHIYGASPFHPPRA